MVQFEKKRLNDGSLHVTATGKIDEKFDGATIVEAARAAPGKIVMHLGGIRSMSSLGVRAFESFFEALRGREVVMIHISPAIASQLTMIPNLCHGVVVESAKLPFTCPSCGAEKVHSVPFRAGANIEHAPTCTCGTRMDLDGIPEQYLPA